MFFSEKQNQSNAEKGSVKRKRYRGSIQKDGGREICIYDDDKEANNRYELLFGFLGLEIVFSHTKPQIKLRKENFLLLPRTNTHKN